MSRYLGLGILLFLLLESSLAADSGASASVLLLSFLESGVQPIPADITTLVSIASDGTKGSWHSNYPSISDNGRYVAFESLSSNLSNNDTNNEEDIFVHDRQTGETVRVSESSDGTVGNEQSRFADISSDGRFIVFFFRC